MIIAAVDPGQRTGLAIFDLQISDEDIVILHKKILTTLEHINNCLNLINKTICNLVILEQRALYGTRLGVEPFEQIKAGLLLHDYRYAASHTFTLTSSKKFITVPPVQWKPYMRAVISTGKINLLAWGADTQHEEDAMLMAFYVVQMNYKNMEVQYD